MTPQVDVVVEDARWDQIDLAALGARLLGNLQSQLDLPQGVAAVIMACDDARIAELNAAFRGKAVPTNVLSWPSEDRAAASPGQPPATPTTAELGDLALAFDTCHQEAISQGKSFDAHVTHLVLHGLLHLLGYDHQTDADADLMEEIEINLLETLGIPNPYEGQLTV